jgi:chromosome segregation ATPase
MTDKPQRPRECECYYQTIAENYGAIYVEKSALEQARIDMEIADARTDEMRRERDEFAAMMNEAVRSRDALKAERDELRESERKCVEANLRASRSIDALKAELDELRKERDGYKALYEKEKLTCDRAIEERDALAEENAKLKAELAAGNPHLGSDVQEHMAETLEECERKLASALAAVGHLRAVLEDTIDKLEDGDEWPWWLDKLKHALAATSGLGEMECDKSGDSTAALLLDIIQARPRDGIVKEWKSRARKLMGYPET